MATPEAGEDAAATPDTGMGTTTGTGTMGTGTMGAGADFGGRVTYAIVSYGGFLGIGETRVLVPFSALRFDAENDAFIVDFDREFLDAAPGFDADNLPEEGTADPNWDADLRAYWQDFTGDLD
jgi:hypothetical protein